MGLQHVARIWLLFLVASAPWVSTAAGVGVRLNGSGTKSASLLFDALTGGYAFARDDVTMRYDPVGSSVATLQSFDVDFNVFERTIDAQAVVTYNISQLPLAGQAVIMAYHLPEFDPAVDPPLALDRATLAAIWIGNVTTWDHASIAALNPELASRLPSANITLGYIDDFYLSTAEVVKLSLSSFSAAFATEFAARNRTFGMLRFVADGRGHALTDSSPDRVAWVAATPYALSFADYVDLPLDGPVRAASIYNRAGRLVEPSVTSVQLAMRDFSEHFAAGDLAVEIYDAPGNESWPLAYVPLVALSNRFVQPDCTRIDELLKFLAWVHTNDGATKAMAALRFAPLDSSLKKRVVDSLESVLCNYAVSFETDFLIGYGAPLSALTAWVNLWSSTATTAGYYETPSADAVAVQSDYGGDFGVTILGARGSMGQSASSSSPVDNNVNEAPASAFAVQDLAVVPLAAFALVPAYNVPGLARTLVLDARVIAAIYLGAVRTWDDSAVAALNPGVALSSAPITVAVHDVDSDINWLITSWLSAEVPDFADAVGPSRRPRYPVQSMVNASIEVTDTFGIGEALYDCSHSFAMWPQFDLGLISRIDKVRAAMVTRTAGGSPVAATVSSVRAALESYILAQGAESLRALDTVVPTSATSAAWPTTVVVNAAYRSESMPDCAKAAALADLIWWTQSDPSALAVAERQGFAVAAASADSPLLRGRLLNALASFECDGAPVSALASCIYQGTLCSDRGTCVTGRTASASRCACDKGYTGTACEIDDSNGGDSSLVTAIAIAVPIAVVLLAVGLCIAIAIAAAVVYCGRRGNGDDDWEIAYDELELGEVVGSGGFGEVRRAMWKGTDVAVKVMSGVKITREMERNFCEEVRVMTALRHPNVVLFMAACTKPPNMCIVMEYMALGSLYELLHNELIPELPFVLKAKMTYQASKGLYFLHSSGIVHRDVKSLNLLLDNKWNVKVSDFGLTKFRADLADGAGAAPIGSVHWMAPEVLNESLDIDYAMADVYSFGIILWEVLTRQQPYSGMSPAAVAVAVIRDDARPRIPSDLNADTQPQAYVDLIRECWHRDPTVRPTFIEIMTRLSAMHGESSGGIGASSSGSSGNDSAPARVTRPRRPDVGAAGINDSWTLPSTSSVGGAGDYDTGTSSTVSAARQGATRGIDAHLPADGVRPPDGVVTVVFADVSRAVSLWEHDPEAMRDATMLYNDVLRGLLRDHAGYEAAPTGTRNTGEGSFCLVFERTADALAWCAAVQRALLEVTWPRALLDHPAAAEEWGGTDDRVIFYGLRARMGVHTGTPRLMRDPATKRVAYEGPAVDAAAKITALAHGGQVVLSAAVQQAATRLLRDESGARWVVRRVGRVQLPDGASASALYELAVPRLEARFFGAGTACAGSSSSSASVSEQSGSHSFEGTHKRSHGDGHNDASSLDSVGREEGDYDRHGRHHHHHQHKGDDLARMAGADEERYLTSANMCRWVIDFADVQLGAQVGIGSYGVVYRAVWKGVNVAVKRFIRQKLDERAMLGLRAETALMLDLDHPNVVVFIGACVVRPNLCLVTEFVRRGSLREVLADASQRLSWAQKMHMIATGAAGVAYLHGRERPIIHRDLKSSNLLVADDDSLKVADFGFARVREDNATMTRCGTPAWTAPEVLRAEHYSEKADVYSFGVVMWEVVTRKQPYSGRNFMAVTMDVLEGNRLDIPADCPADLAKLIRRCWRKNPDKRPSMADIVTALDAMTGGGGPLSHAV
ncbi:Ser/thr kinase [Pandoravirus kuranda]|uniref:non-specific serine/threonine protein kinase n=1 Tax=Pandoravirus kuranda TaxID=3019033 RepID=A0AA95EH09_9VIRU|nr:Ser/thr kinase [Pandoravirus kuranda]